MFVLGFWSCPNYHVILDHLGILLCLGVLGTGDIKIQEVKMMMHLLRDVCPLSQD